MEKRTIQDIATVLVEKNGLEKRAAEQFAQALFAVVSDGLERDGQVKVRGLGTFKIVEVGDRESVSVSTGERVLIQGHAKVTFTPDSTMKELVNKPFSQFETVALNEGVNFEDMGAPLMSTLGEMAEPETEPEVEDAEKTPAEPEADSEVEEVEETPAEPEAEPEVEEVEETPAEPETEPEIEEQKPEPDKLKAEVEKPKPVSYPLEEKEEKSRMTVLKVLGILLLMAAAAAGGYYFGYQKGKQYIQECEVATPIDVPADTTATDSVTVDSTVTAVANDIVQTVPQPEQPAVNEAKPEVQEEKPAAKEEKPAVLEEKPAVRVAEDKWEKTDQRLRYGAYRIVGEDYTIKVRPGETTARMAKRTLGPDMECYIEVFNGIKSNADLKEGQTVKIPKLELKKKRKK